MATADEYKKINYKQLRSIFLPLAIVLLIISLSFELIGYTCNDPFFTNSFEFLFTICLATLALFLACHAIVLSEEANKIAINSDEKMKSIANVEFLKAINMLEDARIEFIKTLEFIKSVTSEKPPKIIMPPGYSPELYTWKTKSSIEMAVELLKRDEKKKYIEPLYQDKLFHYFNMSFKHFFKIPNWKNEKNSQKHLIESYALLDKYYNEKSREELKKYINSKKEEYFENFYKEAAKIKKLDEIVI